MFIIYLLFILPEFEQSVTVSTVSLSSEKNLLREPWKKISKRLMFSASLFESGSAQCGLAKVFECFETSG